MATNLVTADSEATRRLTHSDCDGYDQYGAMLGEVFITAAGADKQQFEINLPGMRQRRWEPTVMGKELRRHGSIIGVCGDGMVVHVGGFSASGIKQ